MNVEMKVYNNQYYVQKRDKYDLPDTINNTPHTQIPVTYLPVTGDVVICYNSRVKITLSNPVGVGGEGTIYKVNKTLACKIYKLERLTIARMEKLRVMISKPISDPEICWPIDIVTNTKGEPVGFTMPIAKGHILTRVHSQTFLQQKFPKWRKRDLAELTLTIASKIKYLHARNVIIGDINTRNIMFYSPSEVYFVDTDSYQIEGFPCPVGTNEYTCADILSYGLEFPKFLRTFGHENFAVAMLIFIILMNGRHPYSYKGGADTVSNIKNSTFPYPYMQDTKFADLIPVGNWRFLWGNFPESVKGAFYSTFSTYGNHNKEKSRMGIDNWVAILTRYLDLLQNCRKNDVINQIFPGLPPISKKDIQRRKSKVVMLSTKSDNTLEKYNRRR